MSNAIARVVHWLDQNNATLQREAPEGYDVDRAKRTLAHLLKQSEKNGANLDKCSPASLVQSCMYLVHLGLDTDMKEAHVIARRNGSGYEADVMIDYRGLLIMAKRSTEVVGVSVDVVRAGDHIDYRRGTSLAENYLEHRPMPFNDGDIIGSYAIFRLGNGLVEFEVMSAKDIKAVRRKAAKGSMAWEEFYGEMAKKAVLRRGLKRLELRPDDKRALDRDDRTWFSYEEARAGAPRVSTAELNARFAPPTKALPAEEPASEPEPERKPPAEPQPKRRNRKASVARIDELIAETGEEFPTIYEAIAIASGADSPGDISIDHLEETIADLESRIIEDRIAYLHEVLDIASQAKGDGNV